MDYNSTHTSINVTEMIRQPATSAVVSSTMVNYKFGEDSIRFTDIPHVESESISQETEDRFYKKAFETKSLQ